MQTHYTSIDHFFRGAFSVDLAVITFHEGKLKLLLEEKTEHPFENTFGLPGNLILANENTDAAIDGISSKLLGTSDFYKKQLRAFSDVDRHPLGRVITFVYYGLIPYDSIKQSKSKKLKWVSIHQIPELPYDHNKIVNHIIKRFKKGLNRHPNVFHLMPYEFTLTELIQIYEITFDKKIDHSNFGKQVKNSELIEPLSKVKSQGNKTGRPPQLYKFNQSKYKVRQERIQFNF